MWDCVLYFLILQEMLVYIAFKGCDDVNQRKICVYIMCIDYF